jgi:diguanylate cyclase (GGDEF)-like protein/PAS domain S-box-containing protein
VQTPPHALDKLTARPDPPGDGPESAAGTELLFDAIARQATRLCGAPVSFDELLKLQPPANLSDDERQALGGLAEIARHAVEMRDALQLAHAQYRVAVHEQAEMISLAMPDGTLLYTNPAYAHQLGRAAGSLVGASLYDFIEPVDREAVRQLILQVVSTGSVAHNENRLRAADGSERWVAWTNSVQAAPGAARLVLSVGRDITSRKQADLALQASASFSERTGHVAGIGGWEFDIARQRLTWSEETRRLHEVAPDYEPVLERTYAFFAPESRPRLEAAVNQAIGTGAAWDLELPFITATGRSIWVRTMGRGDTEADRPARLLGAMQDVTQRRRLEQRVADDEQFLRKLADSLPVRIAYLDRERRYRFANQELLRQLGRSHAQVMGRTRSELLPGHDDAVLAERARAALNGQAQRFEFEESVGGQTRRFENRLIPDRDAAGTVCGFFVTGIDITDRTAAERALRELTTIFDNTTDLVMQTDPQGRVVYMNPAARRAFGVGIDEVLPQHSFSAFVTPATLRLFTDTIVPTVQTGTVWVGETTVVLAGGAQAPMSHMVIAHRDGQGRVEHYASVMRDISAQVQAKQHAARQSEILHSVAEAIPATVVVVGPDSRYRFVNSAFERHCGLPRDQILGRAVKDVMGEAETLRRLPWMKRAFAGESVQFTLDYPPGKGQTYLLLSCIPLRLASGEVDGFVGVGQDITQQKREEERLLQLAQRDPLTGLLNRAGFERSLELYLREDSAGGLAVMYIDLDNFKPINDAHGHPAGDRVLEHFAQRLGAVTRPTDMVARLGGDEFAVAVTAVREVSHARAVAEKVLAAVDAPFEVGGLQLRVGASVGVAYSSAARPDWRELLASADAELLAAKAAGKGRWRITGA